MEFSEKEIKLIYYCLDYILTQLEVYVEDEENPFKNVQCFSLMSDVEYLMEKIKKRGR